MTDDTGAAGLSAAEVARRLAAEGPNALPAADRRSGVAIVLGVLREPMFSLLVAAIHGVNDAPVLAQAQVSVAMGGGAALAQGAADMVLVSARLADLARGIAAAKKALRIVRQNLAWAFAYNIVVLPLAVAGYVTPWMAAIGMSLSSLLVVLNALRARHGARGTRYEE